VVECGYGANGIHKYGIKQFEITKRYASRYDHKDNEVPDMSGNALGYPPFYSRKPT